MLGPDETHLGGAGQPGEATPDLLVRGAQQLEHLVQLIQLVAPVEQHLRVVTEQGG